MNNEPFKQQPISTQEISRALAAVESVVANAPSEVRSALEAASIPHWFDRAILLQLLDRESSSDFDDIFEKISKSLLCEPFSSRNGFNVKKQFRAALRYRLSTENPGQVRTLTRRAIDAFTNDDPTHRVERAYHQLWAEPSNVEATLATLVEDLSRQDQALLQLAITFRDCAIKDSTIPPTIAAWAFWVQATTQTLYLSHQESLELALRGFELAKICGDPNAISALSRLVAELYSLMGMTSEAREYFETSVSVHSSVDGTLPESNAIFISASTREFESETARFAGIRSNLRLFLSRADCEVKVQEEFRQTSVDTIEKLNGYIRKCSAVIHLVGIDPGDIADRESVVKYLGATKDFLSEYPKLRQSLGSCLELTYSQWEACIALHHRVALFVYSTPDAETGQAEHLARLRSVGRHPEVFLTAAELFGKLIGDLHGIVRALPNQNEIAAAKHDVSRLNQGFWVTSNVELINGKAIQRDETAKIMKAIEADGSNGALLVASAGSGKSCILAQLLSELTAKSVPHLAIKLDSVRECNNAESLGRELGLTDSPVTVLFRSAEGKDCVLVVDQLDAISTVSGRKTNTWTAFEELRRQAGNFPVMKLVVACRDFDLEQDHRLRPLGDEKSGFKKIAVGMLSDLQVREALDFAGFRSVTPTSEQFKILTLPFHLVLFLQGKPELPFQRIGDLYDHFWDKKRERLRIDFGSDSHWIDVISALTQYMSDNQATYAPKDVVDKWQGAVQHMVSLHVLVDTGRDYRFFHESFFDYAFARIFCRRGVTLLSFLTKRGEEQHLFRRAQVRQILGYRREHRGNEYLRDLRELLSSSSVRFHIQRMVASELRRVTNPTIEEWNIVKPYLLNHELSPTFESALRGHEGWFDLLLDSGHWNSWLKSDNEILINAAIWFLEDSNLHKTRSKAIAGLLAPYANAGEVWDLRLKRILSWGVAHHSKKMTQIYFDMIRRGCYDEGEKRQSGGDFWGNHYGAEKGNPRFIIDLVRCWLEHAVSKYNDGKSWNFLDLAPLNQSDSGCQLLAKAVKDEPAYFLEQLFPVFEKTVLETEVSNRDILLNRAWPYLRNANDVHDMNDSVFMMIGTCLEKLSEEDPTRLRQFTDPWKHREHETFAFLMLRAYAANPEEFAGECIEYLCTHKPRLNVGYGSWSGGGHGESAVSRETIAAVTPYCSDEQLRRLEDVVIGYCDAYERETPGRRGFAELLVLRSIDSKGRSERGNIRIKELECGFPNVPTDTPPRDLSSMFSVVGSPIPDSKAALMTDDQWVGAMTKYDGSTDRFLGGPFELSRVLSDLTRRDRTRFAKLALKLPESVDSIYFSAILDGLGSFAANLAGDAKKADEKELSSFPIELLEQVIQRAHSLPTKPCGSSISNLIERLADRELATATLDALAYYATEDPDPEDDIWKDKSRNYYGGNPLDHGINTVRGRAAIAIGRLIFTSQNHWNHFRPTIETVICDPVISVRVCAVETLISVLNWDRDEAVRLFIECCKDTQDTWGARPFNEFVYYAIRTHHIELRELLLAALACNNKEAVESAASQIILFDLANDSLKEEAESVRKGNEWMREAACRVYAQNVGHAEVGNICAERIVQFFDDESDEVRDQIGKAFWNVDGERLLELETMIRQYIESRSFESDPEELLRVLVKSQAELPNVIVRAAERIVTIIGDKGSKLQFREASTAHSIATLVVRQYAQTSDAILKRKCLNLIDQMERSNYMGLNDELEKIDR